MAFPRLQVDDVSEGLVEAYCHYELVERRLGELTVVNASYTVRQFLAWRAQTGRGPIEGLEPSELEEFVVHEAGRVKRGSLRSKVGFMRTFMRFLYATGVTERDLSSSVPWVASGRFDGLPRSLDPGLTMATVIGLMAATGLRPGETYRLGRDHVDLAAGRLAVMHSKHGKSRQIPLHTTTIDALGRYARLRDGSFTDPAGSGFFLTASGSDLTSEVAARCFRRLVRTAGIDPAGGGRSPARLGDLRHSFAVHTLLSWHHGGVDVQRQLPVLSAFLGHNEPGPHLLVFAGRPRADGLRRRPLLAGPVMTAAAPLIQGFFTQRLPQQRVSAHTIASYRDCFKLLLRFARTRTGRPPAQLDLTDLDALLVGAFLDHLETDRHNGIDTRNLRLTAIQSFFRYLQLDCPEHAGVIARVLAIPAKRPDQTIVSYLTPAEVDALLAAPDRSTPLGRRDHLLMMVAGPDRPASVRADRTALPRHLLRRRGQPVHQRQRPQATSHPAHPADRPAATRLDRTARTATGGAGLRYQDRRPLSNDAVQDLVAKHVAAAAEHCKTLHRKRITPHTLRHYGDDWVMWLAGVFPLTGLPRLPIPAT